MGAARQPAGAAAVKINIRVGEVHVIAEDVTYTRRDIRRLLAEVAGIAVAMSAEEPERQAVGFAVITERAAEPPKESYFTDDDE